MVTVIFLKRDGNALMETIYEQSDMIEYLTEQWPTTLTECHSVIVNGKNGFTVLNFSNK